MLLLDTQQEVGMPAAVHTAVAEEDIVNEVAFQRWAASILPWLGKSCSSLCMYCIIMSDITALPVSAARSGGETII